MQYVNELCVIETDNNMLECIKTSYMKTILKKHTLIHISAFQITYILMKKTLVFFAFTVMSFSIKVITINLKIYGMYYLTSNLYCTFEKNS